MVRVKSAQTNFVTKYERRINLEDMGVDGRIILKYILDSRVSGL
jgi:hypothetical protein